MRKKRFAVIAIVATMSLGAASPAFADCCSSFWDCAATVATEGVSCAIQEFIDTINSITTFVKNVMDQATGITQQAEHDAQQGVSDTIDQFTSQSQSSSADLAQAEQSAKKLAQDESKIPEYSAKQVASMPTVSAAAKSSVTSPSASAAQPPAAGGNMRAVERNPNVAATHPGAAPAASTVQRTAVRANGEAPVSQPTGTSATTMATSHGSDMQKVGAPPRAYLDEMNRAYAVVQKEKVAGDQDFTKVNSYMTTARTSEGQGLKGALQIANSAVEAPFKAILSKLEGMLTNPTDLTDPSSVVEAAANSLLANIDVSSAQIVDSITSGPNAAFAAAQPSYDDLQGRADHAQRIAKAMDLLYRDRTPGALVNLDSLLPRTVTVATGPARTSARISGRVASSEVMTKFSASRVHSRDMIRERVKGLSTQLAKLDAVRAKYRTAHAGLATTRVNFGSKLDAIYAGKTPAQIAVQRDSLIAEAKTRFAKDPKTRDAVVNLLSSETAKRATMVRH